MRERRSPPAHDRRYFARPRARCSTRCESHFAIGDQLRVWNVIESNISLALDLLERAPELLGLDGVPASAGRTRERAPPASASRCPGRDYCPSHKHLEETFEAAEEVELPGHDDELVAA